VKARCARFGGWWPGSLLGICMRLRISFCCCWSRGAFCLEMREREREIEAWRGVEVVEVVVGVVESWYGKWYWRDLEFIEY